MATKDKFKITLANSDLNSRKTFTTGYFRGVDYGKTEERWNISKCLH